MASLHDWLHEGSVLGWSCRAVWQAEERPPKMSTPEALEPVPVPGKTKIQHTIFTPNLKIREPPIMFKFPHFGSFIMPFVHLYKVTVTFQKTFEIYPGRRLNPLVQNIDFCSRDEAGVTED